MKLLPRILSSVRVLEVTLTADSHTVAAWHCTAGGEITPAQYDPASAAKNLVAVTVSGHGTVIKPADSDIAARVHRDSDTFLWSEHDGDIGFVRRERLQEVLSALAATEIHPQRIAIGLAPATLARALFDSLRWRDMLRPTAEGSALAQRAVRRMGLPVLGLFLCLLTANVLLAPEVGTRRQTLHAQLAAREHTASAAADVTARQRTLLAQFDARPEVSRALLCDRIAAAVPEGVVLTQLAVEPLTRRFEADKPLQRHERTAVVAGTAPMAGDISAFVERLTAESCCRTVRLTNVERERDATRLVFRIEIGL